jgi:putative nucleotidyltransferase with HDIG domain
MSKELLTQIAGMLKAPSPKKQIAAAVVVQELGARTREIYEGLAQMLESGSTTLQRPALEALAALGGKPTFTSVVPLLGSRDPEIRKRAADVLVAVGDEATAKVKERAGAAGGDERAACKDVLARIASARAAAEAAEANAAGRAFRVPGRVGLAAPSPQGGLASAKQRLEQYIKDVPVLPTVLAKLMALDTNSDAHFDEMLRLIESEPNFSARLLAAANSAASAPRNPITSVRSAFLRLGSVPATNLVLSVAVTQMIPPRDDSEKSVWRHCLDTAVTARHLAAAWGDPEVDPEVAYTCGLLHDLGRFVIFRLESEGERSPLAEGEGARELLAAERTLCGMTHPEVGAMVCTKWRLPDRVVTVVRDHHREVAPRGVTGKLIAVLRHADTVSFPSTQRSEWLAPEVPREERVRRVEGLRPPFLTISAEQFHDLLQVTAADAEAAASSLGLG